DSGAAGVTSLTPALPRSIAMRIAMHTTTSDSRPGGGPRIPIDRDVMLGRLYADSGMVGFDHLDGSWPLVGRTDVLDRFVGLLDDASVTLVQQLAATPDVLLVVTARTDVRRPTTLGWLTRDGAVARVDLEALTAADVEELATKALGHPLADAAARWLVTTSG